MSKINTDAGMPIRLTLDAGIYFRCNCGKSSTLPFCDGGHRSGDQPPTRFELKSRQQVYLCSCGKTAQAPYCDESCGVPVSKL